MQKEVKFKDVAHLYLKVWGFLDIGEPPHFTKYEQANYALSTGILHDLLVYDRISFKPELRRYPQDISDQENLEYQMIRIQDDKPEYQIKAEQFVYLLEKGFDLFGLIKSGQAKEVHKIKKTDNEN